MKVTEVSQCTQECLGTFTCLIVQCGHLKGKDLHQSPPSPYLAIRRSELTPIPDEYNSGRELYFQVNSPSAVSACLCTLTDPYSSMRFWKTSAVYSGSVVGSIAGLVEFILPAKPYAAMEQLERHNGRGDDEEQEEKKAPHPRHTHLLKVGQAVEARLKQGYYEATAILVRKVRADGGSKEAKQLNSRWSAAGWEIRVRVAHGNYVNTYHHSQLVQPYLRLLHQIATSGPCATVKVLVIGGLGAYVCASSLIMMSLHLTAQMSG